MTQEQNIGRAARQNASLSSTPQTLYVSWEEYTKGLVGAKAAKHFTTKARGTVKHKYLLRKVFWDCVIRLVDFVLSANVAIDQIYTAYGRKKNCYKNFEGNAKG